MDLVSREREKKLGQQKPALTSHIQCKLKSVRFTNENLDTCWTLKDKKISYELKSLYCGPLYTALGYEPLKVQD